MNIILSFTWSFCVWNRFLMAWDVFRVFSLKAYFLRNALFTQGVILLGTSEQQVFKWYFLSRRWDILRGILRVMVPRKETFTGLLTSRTNSGLVLIQVKEINGKFHMNMSIWGCQLKQHCMCAIAQNHWYIFFLQFHQNTRQRSVKVSVYCNSYLSNAGQI